MLGSIGKVLARLTENYDVFLHLLDASGNVVAQTDRQPLSGLAPTSFWEPGERLRDAYTIPLPADLAPDSYRIKVGFYLRESGPATANHRRFWHRRGAALDSAYLP